MAKEEFSFNDLFPESRKRRREEDYHDKALKHIGDRVVIIDYSSVTDVDGEMLDDKAFDEIYGHEYLIVAETNQYRVFKTNHHTYRQDLVIAHPKTKRLYRVISGHVTHYHSQSVDNDYPLASHG